MESNDNFESYVDYDYDQDENDNDYANANAYDDPSQYNYAQPNTQYGQNTGQYDQYQSQYQQPSHLDTNMSQTPDSQNVVTGAIPQMDLGNAVPSDPYKDETPEERKRRRLKEIKKNRFQTAMPPQNYITQGMQNMDINSTGGNISPSQATVPQDMRNTNNPNGSYQDSGARDYSRVNVSNKAIGFKTQKPKDDINLEHVRHGMLEEYSTDCLDVPPCPAIPYTSIDVGQSSPKFMRPTMYRVPSNYTLHKNTRIPFGLIIQPMADISDNESYIPKAECGADGPLRCNTCGGYVNPGTIFIENGSKARCNFCASIFPVDDTKYSFVSDKSALPELYYGSYEFDVAGKYVYYAPRSPIYLFIIDVSHDSHQNGMFTQVLESLKSTLDSIPNPENTQICIFTVDQHVQCYTFPSDVENGPKVYETCEMTDPFIPVPFSELMLNLQTDRHKIDILLEKLPEIHLADEAKLKTAALNLSSAFVMALELLSDSGGRVLAFTSRLDNAGPGTNKVEESHKMYNTDSEKSLFKCNSDFYKDLSSDFFKKRITVDMFSCTYHNVNLANPTRLCTSTGGDVYYFKQFSDKFDGEKLHYDVFRILTRNNAYDVAFRVRCSEGYSVVKYLGNFMAINAIDFEMPSIDADKTIGVVFRSEGAITNVDKLSVQTAMLYSTPDGERKIRVLNLYLPLEKRFSSIFRYIDQDTLFQHLVKQSLSNIGFKTVVSIKEQLISSVVEILAAFRKDGVSVTNPTEIIVPDSLRYINLYCLGALKSIAFKLLGETKADEKYHWILKFMGTSMPKMIKMASPRCYKVTDIQNQVVDYGYAHEETGKIVKPPICDNSFEYVDTRFRSMENQDMGSQHTEGVTSSDLCIIDDGEYIYLYVGSNLPNELIYDIFGYEDFKSLVHYGVSTLDVLMETDAYTRIINVIDQIRSENDGAYQPIKVVLEGSIAFKKMLMYTMTESTTNKNREYSYQEFLSYLHNTIRQM